MKYIKQFTIFAFVILATVSVFNWFVDPYGMYWSPTIKGFNENKPAASNRIRVTKPHRVSSLQPQVLIMGNSRVEIGIKPNTPLLRGKTVYNLSLAGATLHSQIDHIYHAAHDNQRLETVILGIDFFDFLVTETGNETDQLKTSYSHRLKYFQNEPDSKNKNLELFSLVFSLDSLESSLRTILTQNSIADTITPLGFNDAQSYVEIIQHEGKVPLFKQKLAFIEYKLRQKQWQLHSKEGTPFSPKFEKLMQLITHLKANNIELKLFINPYHYTYLQKINDEGYFELYLAWKKLLCRFLMLEKNSNTQIIDFSGFNKYSLEHSALNQPYQRMIWFWEPAHYTSELGDIILKRLYTSENIEFGVNINCEAIQKILEQERQALIKSQLRWHDVKAYF